MRDLDKILSSATPGQIIQLPRGIVTTMGVTDAHAQAKTGSSIKDGITIEGHRDGTTIVCARDSEGPEVSVLFGDAADITVRNLHVDCGPASSEKKRNGIYLLGKNSQVHNVHVVRPWGCLRTMRESFGINVSLRDEDNSAITLSAVTQVLGDYQTAIQGKNVSDCITEYPMDNRPAFRVAYNIGGSKGARITSCRSHWATHGIYWDWEDVVDAEISNCTFHGCGSGMFLNARQAPEDTASRRAQKIVFRSNEIYLNPDLQEVSAFAMVHSNPEGIHRADNTLHAITDVLIQDNVIRFLPGPIRSQARYAMNASSFLDPSKRSPELGITNVRFVDNDVLDSDQLTWRNWQGRADVTGSVKRTIEFTQD